jgi:hypothetical protein
MFEKIWSRRRVFKQPDGQTLIYVDRHLIRYGYAPAFEFLDAGSLSPRVPERVFTTLAAPTYLSSLITGALLELATTAAARDSSARWKSLRSARARSAVAVAAPVSNSAPK